MVRVKDGFVLAVLVLLCYVCGDLYKLNIYKIKL